MSRIGKLPIGLPVGTKITLTNGQLQVEGPKGKLARSLPPEIELEVKTDEIRLKPRQEKSFSAISGLWRSLINNMVKGVNQGYEKELKLVGTGYRARFEGEKLVIACGFSHPVEVVPPQGIVFEVVENETIKVRGLDKELVGLWAARVRAVRPPEPYKGKGIRYSDEFVRRKAGKTAKAAGATGKGAA